MEMIASRNDTHNLQNVVASQSVTCGLRFRQTAEISQLPGQ